MLSLLEAYIIPYIIKKRIHPAACRGGGLLRIIDKKDPACKAGYNDPGASCSGIFPAPMHRPACVKYYSRRCLTY